MAKLNENKIQECADWVRENGLMEYGGARLKDFCTHLTIDAKTYYRWMNNTDFANAIKKAKDDFRNNLEHDLVISLAKSAKGYDYEQTTTEWTDVNGKPKIKKQVKKNIHVEPNVGANIFLLTNINPDKWKNKQNSDVTTNGKDIGQQIVFSPTPLSEKDIQEIKDIQNGNKEDSNDAGISET